MEPVTGPQQTALEAPVVAWAWFVEMVFKSATTRVSNFNQNFSWGGFEWQGLGSLGGISEIKSSEKIEPNAVTLSLTLAQPGWLALAVGPVEEYRGGAVRIYCCPLTPAYQLIDTPLICWSGEMDVMAIGVNEDGAGNIQLRCEPVSKRLRRRATLRVNAVQHKARHPTDTGFDFQADLLANPITWLSVAFQRQ